MALPGISISLPLMTSIPIPVSDAVCYPCIHCCLNTNIAYLLSDRMRVTNGPAIDSFE